ncbi:baseplate J/gp47 family protein [Halomonas sp. MC140]|nr:baseplate J/gp47 family protein [Halomonas sp. MC140]MDN7131775.1 baseplate J/gp47 family protein [Halomonas sp. MC140]
MITPIDLSKLPAPRIIETLDFEQIFNEMRDDLIERDPSLEGMLALESEPLVKLLQVAAYRELMLRQHHNDRVRQLLLAYATDEVLDHIGISYFFTERLIIEAGDPDATPPVPPTLENDDDYRRRLLLAPDRFSTAGSEASYQYYALGTAAEVKDVTASSPSATQVIVAILSREGTGAASALLINQVQETLSAALVRPLTDHVQVVSADIISYQVSATLHIRPGPDPMVVRQSAIEAVTDFVERRHRLGSNIVRDAVLAALYVEGVERVELAHPVADITCSATQAAHCSSVGVIVDG